MNANREKVIQGLKLCLLASDAVSKKCTVCPYKPPMHHALENNDESCCEGIFADAVALLKEQEEQKRKWLQAIADTQLAVSPTGYETEEELAKRTGEWNGLQMAWDILTEGR